MSESHRQQLPSGPSTLCFNKEDFMKDDFNVEHFVVECRRKVPLEMLRNDLNIYLRILQSAMIELINKDYADFVNLSTNLVGMDKAINNLLNPLGHLKNEILVVRSAMVEASSVVEEKMKHLSRIRSKKNCLRTLMCMVQSVDKMEQLLGLRARGSGDRTNAYNSDLNGQLIERVATEFNRLQFYVSRTGNLPVVDELKPRISVITQTLQSGLEAKFREGLNNSNAEVLRDCLRTYATIDKMRDAENLFRSYVVKPYMEEVINEQFIQSNRHGLQGMYNAILEFFPLHCSQVCEITSGSSQSAVSGFDFVVNTIWPEVVANIEARTSSIFAPGNPNVFHEKYTISIDFVERFERHCSSQSSVKQLRAHPSYSVFMSKWSLSVYFQIRFQEIAGSLETSLFSPFSQSLDKTLPFQLQCTVSLWQSIHRCWDEDIYLQPLCHRFWKLTLQLLSRYSTWLEELQQETIQCQSRPETVLQSMPKTASDVNLAAMVSNNSLASSPSSVNNSSVNLTSPTALKVNVSDVVAVVVDVEVICTKLKEFFSSVVVPRLAASGPENLNILRESIDDSEKLLSSHMPLFEVYVTNEIASICVVHLKAVCDIPRLYRRTNRELPSKPSSYVASVFKPVVEFLDEQQNLLNNMDRRQKWMTAIVQTICDQYLIVTNDVLTSVKKMEESLKRLKAGRGTSSSAGTQGLSDDDKIRTQLYLDVKEFGLQIVSMGLKESDVASYVKLFDLTSTAVNTMTSST